MNLSARLRSIWSSLGRAGRPPVRAGDWTRLAQILGGALDRPPEQRDAFLNEVCAGDRRLRAEAASLLAASDSPGVVDRPLDDLVTSLLTAEDTGTGRSPNRRVIAHYELLERLPGGGMGVIYRARDVRLRRVVALKFLPGALSADDRAKARFLLEARAAASLDHRNVCAIHEIGETEEGHLFIAMPFYEGETLADRIAREPLSVGDALTIAIQVLHGLTHAHEHGIVHRDIKPANVMLGTDGVVKILDFGIVKHGDVGFTRTGVLIGTLPYMSPEQLTQSPVDARTDIWSVGIVLYEMLAGRQPFEGGDVHAVREAIVFAQPASLRAMRSDVSEELARAVATALAKQRQDRPASAPAFAATLETILGGAAGDVGDTVSSRQEEGPRQNGESRRRVADAAQVLPGGERRQATIVVSGVSGFAELMDRCAPNEVEEVIRRLKQDAWEIVERHSGTINEFGEDRIVLLFGVPASTEDHCARAVRAALELHALVRGWRQTRSTARNLALRTAIDTGEAAVQRAEGAVTPFRIVGRPVSRATQLCAHARSDEILISPQAERAVSPLFDLMPADPLSLPEDVEPLTPHRVVGASAAQDALEQMAVRVTLTAFTGRDRELHTLDLALQTMLGGRGRFVAITGEAGVGKSRLLLEFRRTIESPHVKVFVGRCTSYGQATAYMPLLDVLRQVLGLDAATRAEWTDAAVVAGILRVDTSLEDFVPFYLRLLSIATEKYRIPGSMADAQLRLALQEALVSALVGAAARQPVVLFLEDWHWSDPASHAVLKQTVDLVSNHRLMIVLTSRSGHGVDWQQRDGCLPLELRPLEPASTATMLNDVLRVDDVPADLATRIHERTGGNPFFVEEIARSLMETGTILFQGARVSLAGALDTLYLPATVQAVIRARLDRMDLDARQVLRAASAVGRDFSRAIMERAVVDADRLAPALNTLVTSGIIQQTRVFPEASYRFRHALAQEAAYAGLLEHQRAELHARIGTAIEDIHQSQLAEWFDRLAHHFSLAERWEKAVHYGVRSADRMIELCQFTDALHLLDRALSWMQQGVSRSGNIVDVLLRQERLCDTLGLRERQRQIIEELVARIESATDRSQLAEAYLRKGDLHTVLHQFEEAERALECSLSLRRDAADSAGERTTLRSLGFLRWHQERYADALTYVNDALRIARQDNNLFSMVGVLQNAAWIHKAAGDHHQARLCFEEALRLSEPAAGADAAHLDLWWQRVHILHGYGCLLSEGGELDRALECFTAPAEWARKNRLAVEAAFFYTAIAHVHLRKGNVSESLEYYRQAVDLTRRGRYQPGLAASLRLFGEVLLGIGREQEAVGHLRESAQIFGELEDRLAEALTWGRVATAEQRLGNFADAVVACERARAIRRQAGDRRGELEAVEALGGVARRHLPASAALGFYEEAISLACALDDGVAEARLRNAAGIIEWTRGRHADALVHFERGLELFRTLGDPAGAGLMMNSIGVTLKALGRTEEARETLERAVASHAQTGQAQLEGYALAVLGDLSWESDNAEGAADWYGRSLSKRQSIGDQRGEGWMLHRLARVRAARDHCEEADTLLARATELSVTCSDEELMDACAQLRRQANGR
jgi:serine/threonine protein kinase/tetratricopeptide (TPR) repeat protein